MRASPAFINKLIPGQTAGLKRISLFLFVAALYLLLSLTVHLRLWAGLDLATTLFLERMPRSLDTLLSVFSLIGSAEVTGLVILFYALFFCPPGSRIRLIVLFALIAILEWVGKDTIHQPGPPDVFYRYTLPFSFPTSSLMTPFSFPSGHSARTVFITFVLVVWIRQSRLGTPSKQILFAMLAVGEFVMLVTRVSLGEHWFSDVVGGVLLATTLVLPWLYSLKAAPFPLSSQLTMQHGSPE